MAVRTGFRPRSPAERLEAARLVLDGGTSDDPWVATCLAAAGKGPSPRPDLVGGPVPADAPRVTVLICTYNRAHLVGEAIASARAQTWPVEIVVVDDGSTDGTPEVLARTEGVRIVRKANGGKSSALNAGLAEARGDAVLVLDDDDLLLPGGVEVLARILFSRPELAAVCADTIVFGDAAPDWRPAARTPGTMAHRTALTQIPAMPGATLIRMTAQRAAGDYDPRLIRGQDMDMVQRVAAIGPIESVPLPTFLYRSHDEARGSAAGQWRKKRDPAEHRRRFLACVQPVFRERWAASRHDRDLGFAWALGLWERELRREARRELGRWSGPWSASEAWIRTHCGMATEPARTSETLVVVDDGDEGALEETLWRHATGRTVVVDLEVSRDAAAKLWWPGVYVARADLGRICPPGPVALRWSSAPEWSPPPIPRPEFPPVGGASAVLALAAALDWELPIPTRGDGRCSPVATALLRARRLMRAGRYGEAMGPLADAMERLGPWPPGWAMVGECFRRGGFGQGDRPVEGGAPG